jgi:hypothetical protein
MIKGAAVAALILVIYVAMVIGLGVACWIVEQII